MQVADNKLEVINQNTKIQHFAAFKYIYKGILTQWELLKVFNKTITNYKRLYLRFKVTPDIKENYFRIVKATAIQLTGFIFPTRLIFCPILTDLLRTLIFIDLWL